MAPFARRTFSDVVEARRGRADTRSRRHWSVGDRGRRRSDTYRRLLLRPVRQLQRARPGACRSSASSAPTGSECCCPSSGRAASRRCSTATPGEARNVARFNVAPTPTARRGRCGRCELRAHRQLRLQGPLPRLSDRPRLLAGGKRHPRPGRVPGPLSGGSPRGRAGRRAPCGPAGRGRRRAARPGRRPRPDADPNRRAVAPAARPSASPITSPAISRLSRSATPDWSC